jgi:hypothetical protein
MIGSGGPSANSTEVLPQLASEKPFPFCPADLAVNMTQITARYSHRVFFFRFLEYDVGADCYRLKKGGAYPALAKAKTKGNCYSQAGGLGPGACNSKNTSYEIRSTGSDPGSPRGLTFPL